MQKMCSRGFGEMHACIVFHSFDRTRYQVTLAYVCLTCFRNGALCLSFSIKQNAPRFSLFFLVSSAVTRAGNWHSILKNIQSPYFSNFETSGNPFHISLPSKKALNIQVSDGWTGLHLLIQGLNLKFPSSCTSSHWEIPAKIWKSPFADTPRTQLEKDCTALTLWSASNCFYQRTSVLGIIPNHCFTFIMYFSLVVVVWVWWSEDEMEIAFILSPNGKIFL